ncbi:chromosome partitioning protein ParB [Sphingomonas koreensis]|nr:chromosome partitioning protein ParB [Sphingomonas koreensis]
MKLDFIALDKLVVSKTNMRYAKKAPDVTDMLPSVRKRGILQPVIVRPNCAPDGFEVVAGFRRFTAATIVAEERRAEGADADPMPCAILDDGDDADAVEASLIENIARRDADEVTQWETFTRLVKEGRTPEDIGTTFGLPELAVKRVLALGNLLPRIRALYAREEIDRATVRHLTLASKSQQKAWLALADDDNAYCPTGHQLKAWLFGGGPIPVRHALFDVEASGVQTITDLFGEERWFADASAFWAAQNDAIEARRAAYLDAGWPDAIVIPLSERFHSWEYEKAGKRKGGRVYIEVRASGEVTVHEGYLSAKEAARAARSDSGAAGDKPKRPELTSTMQTYVDLHRHAAVRAALTGYPGVALRLMVAHAVTGSRLWRVQPEPQSARNDAVRESVENSRGEADFDERRRAVLAVLDFAPDEPTVTGGNGDDYGLVGLFRRLLDLPDAVVMEVIAIVMGETLASGSAAVEAVGLQIGIDMASYWQADDAFFALLRDKQVLTRIVAEIAGESVAAANAGEKTKTMKQIVRDHLDGVSGREKREHWVPKWMAFPPSAYTGRGGVGTVAAYGKAGAALVPDSEPDPAAPAPVAALPAPDDAPEPDRLAA